MLKPPISSEFDPSEESEGSIDPLGLAPIYERLADRMLPGVTVRMGRPRFLTAIVAGTRVCQGWEREDYATDGVSPPWLVYEWFVVEAFVKAMDELQEVRGIPGIQKVERALRAGRPVSASAYLKTPTVFGFTGVFRRLARHIRLVTDDGRLDDAGYELLKAWEADQGLPGFLDGSSGAGAAFRERLEHAVRQGMGRGTTTNQPGDFWREVARHLDPSAPGKLECEVLLRLIRERSGPSDMVSAMTRGLLKAGKPIEFRNEAKFLRSIQRTTPAEMQELLSAIDAYEVFGRTIANGFDGLRYLATQNKGAWVGGAEFAALPLARVSRQVLKPAIDRIRDHPSLLEWEKGLREWLVRFEEVHDEATFYDALLAHHEKIQKDKPPEGKRRWFESGKGAEVMLRPGFVLKELPDPELAYLHDYRTPTFSRFLADLRAYS